MNMSEYTPIRGRHNLPREAKRVITEALANGWQIDPKNPIIVASEAGTGLIMKGFDSVKMVAEELYDMLALPSIGVDDPILLAVKYVRDEDEEPASAV